jgi:thioredoxin reductase (NADPH)
MEVEGVHETIILGSGPAGLTAAIYAARSRCCPLVIHGGQPGGQLTSTTVIDNFPGFPDGIEGSLLVDNMQRQALRFGVRFRPLPYCNRAPLAIRASHFAGKRW